MSSSASTFDETPGGCAGGKLKNQMVLKFIMQARIIKLRVKETELQFVKNKYNMNQVHAKNHKLHAIPR